MEFFLVAALAAIVFLLFWIAIRANSHEVEEDHIPDDVPDIIPIYRNNNPPVQYREIKENKKPAKKSEDYDDSFLAGVLVAEMLSDNKPAEYQLPNTLTSPSVEEPDNFVGGGGESGGAGASGTWDDNTTASSTLDFSNDTPRSDTFSDLNSSMSDSSSSDYSSDSFDSSGWDSGSGSSNDN